MKNKKIKSILSVLTLLSSIQILADVDMQKGVYDAAEEMIQFDEKMNKAIEEHNKIDAKDDAEMQLELMMINDFEETKNGYVFNQTIENPEHTKVEVKVEEDLLIISTTTIEKEVLKGDFNISTVSTMRSFTNSLFIPNDADESRMEKDYNNGELRVFFPKK